MNVVEMQLCVYNVTSLFRGGPNLLFNEPFMERGVGPARYRDLNSDLPSCISKFHIQDGHEPNRWAHERSDD